MNSDNFKAPREFQSLVGSLLHEDEKLVCWRRPHLFLSMLLNSTLLVTSFAFAAALTAFVLTRLEIFHAYYWLFCLIASAFNAATLALLLVAQWRHSRRMLFLVTTERAICCIPRLLGSYRICELPPEHAGRVCAGGIGNLIGWIAWKVAYPPFLVGMPMWVRNMGFGLIARPKDLRQVVLDVLSAKLVARLKHHDNAVRREAIASLAKLAKTKSVSIHALAEALRSEDSFIRAQAAKALGTLGQAAQPALPCLRIAALDENPSVAQAALRAIEQVSQAA